MNANSLAQVRRIQPASPSKKPAGGHLQVVDQPYLQQLNDYRRSTHLKRPVRLGKEESIAPAPAPAPAPLSRPFSKREIWAWVAAFVVVILGSGLFGWAFSGSTWDGPVTSVQVQAGESLWQVAQDLAIPGMETGQVVDTIISLNSLDSATIHPGQTLTVPAK